MVSSPYEKDGFFEENERIRAIRNPNHEYHNRISTPKSSMPKSLGIVDQIGQSFQICLIMTLFIFGGMDKKLDHMFQIVIPKSWYYNGFLSEMAVG